MVDLDEDQIIELLAENGETNIESLDKEYDQTENILREIQSIQNIGDGSIFTGELSSLNLKYYLIFLIYISVQFRVKKKWHFYVILNKCQNKL